MKKIRFFWHIHHNVLVEPLTESLKTRIAFIKKNKPQDETKLRLKLLKPVKGRLPVEVVKARKASDKAREVSNKAWEVYDKAKEAYDKAREAYNKQLRKNKKQIEALHKKECGCGWDGKSIFKTRRV